MPEIVMYDINNPGLLDDLAGDETAVRAAAIENAWKYYNGQHRKPLKVRAGQADDNVIINLVQKMVDQSVSMLFGETPEMELANEGDTEQLEAVWKANDEEIFLHNLAISGALAGQCFVKLSQEENGIKLVALNPAYVTVFWAQGDISRILVYRVQWTLNDVRYRYDVVDMGGRWEIIHWTSTSGQGWKQGEVVEWQYAFSPIVSWQNLPDSKSFYGRSDLYNAALNDSVNFVASNVNRILKFHAHPRTIGLGLAPDAIKETAVDGFWAIGNENAKIQNLEMQSDLVSSMSYLQFLQAAFYSQHRAVDLSTIQDKLGQLTNFGLRMLYKDALDKLYTKQSLYGAGLAEVGRRCGMLLGREWGLPEVRFADPLPQNGVEEVQSVKEQIGLGIMSKQTGSTILGNDWQTEQERMAQEKEDAQGALGTAIANAMRGFDRGNTAPDMEDDDGDFVRK